MKSKSDQILEDFGIKILYALTKWDTTVPEALDRMRVVYGRRAVSKWLRKHPRLIEEMLELSCTAEELMEVA